MPRHKNPYERSFAQGDYIAEAAAKAYKEEILRQATQGNTAIDPVLRKLIDRLKAEEDYNERSQKRDLFSGGFSPDNLGHDE